MEVKINDRLKWVEHNGTDILIANYKNLKGAEFVDLVHLNNEYIISVGKNQNRGLLILSDITGTVMGTEAVFHFKQGLTDTAPYTKARAQVGTEGMKKHILQYLNQTLPFEARSFDNLDEAKDWLSQTTTSIPEG